MKLPSDIWELVKMGEPTECWPFTGRLTTGGYGQMMTGGRRLAAHRIVFTLAHGSIPDGMFVDHKCHNEDRNCKTVPCPHRACCNPAHLELATPRENVLRSHLHQAGRTHCPQGHEYNEENVRIGRNGGRYCIPCSLEHARNQRARARNNRK